MIRITLIAVSLFISFLLSSNLKAEVCEGIISCTNLFNKFTGEKIQIDTNITKKMSISATGTDFVKLNAKKEFELYLNKNSISLSGNKLQVMRSGEYLNAPIYLVSLGNMPMMFNKDGLVTLVYQSAKETKHLVNVNTKRMLSKNKSKSQQKIIEFPKTKIVAVSDTYEYASKIMNDIMKKDK